MELLLATVLMVAAFAIGFGVIAGIALHMRKGSRNEHGFPRTRKR